MATSFDTRSFNRDLQAQIPHLRRFARSLTKDSSKAEDLLQDTLLKALEAADRYDDSRSDSSFRGWLFVIARNLFLTKRRRSLREVEDVDDVLAGKLVANGNPETEALDRESEERAKKLLERIRENLRKVPEQYRTAIWLVYVEGHKYEEAAVIAECPSGTIKSRVSRGIDHLSQLMGIRGAEDLDFTPEQWSMAFQSLSPTMDIKQLAPARLADGIPLRERKRGSVLETVFCGLVIQHMRSVRFGRGPSSELFRFA